ncbi:hypothetical protein L7F22_056632 [Adiantum nelumboides]|nr:hypothetical protein [Adiantum nelumboides]
MWKDHWVVSLCHERGALQDEFNKPQKRRIDLWSRIANCLAALYSDFDKDSEACRKKWSHVYDLYKANKVHNSISDKDIQRSCKWYDIVNEYMHDRAHVKVYSHASVISEGNGDYEASNSCFAKEETKGSNVSSSNVGVGKVRGKGKKDEQLEEFIADARENGRGVLSFLQESAKKRESWEVATSEAEARRLHVLESLSSAVIRYLDRASSN